MSHRTISHFRDMTLWLQTALLVFALAIPILLSGSAYAAPTLAERELQSTSARPSQNTDLTWVFDTTADTANIDHIEIEFCDTPLGVCTAPANIPTINSATPTVTLTGFTTNTTTASDRQNGDGGGTNNQIRVDKTTVDAGANLDEATISFGSTDFTNDSSANTSYYTRVRFYSDTGTTLVWEGVFAQSTSQTLTVNARVQERLDFCVGATTVNDATTTPGAACANITGTNVDIGNVESGFSNVSPVTATNGGDNENGIAMVRTNAVNGVVVDYKSILNTSSGTLKVTGSTCSGVSTTDQCFNASSTQSTLTNGTEEFGMTIAGINCGSTTAYTCTFAAGTYNLVRDAAYDGNGANTYVTDTDQVSGATNGGYAWDDSAAADRIASSAGSAVKVVDDEAMILKFAATAAATTPTGSYTVQSDFIATATF